MQKKHSQNAQKQTLCQANAAAERMFGRDARSLAALCQADALSVRRQGLTNARIAGRLRALRRAGWNGLGATVLIPPHFEVRVDAARGLLACPFGDQNTIAKVNTTVRNLKTARQIIFSDLNIHLIAAHGFYERHGTNFRLEPAHLADTLEIGKIRQCKK